MAYTPKAGSKSQYLVLTDETTVFNIVDPSYGGKGVEVQIKTKDEQFWSLTFAAPEDQELLKGIFENTFRYPFNGPDNAGVALNIPGFCFNQPTGKFEILELIRKKDKIKSLAINYTIQSSLGELFEGSIRYKSKIPVTIEKPAQN